MTRTSTYPAVLETTNQFLDDYQIDPRSVFIHARNNSVTVLVDGIGAAAEIVSENLYWETDPNGITAARILYDGTDITVQVYES